MHNFGYATYKRGKLYFDEKGWAVIKSAAKRTHKSPQIIVIQAIKRFIKRSSK